MKQRVWFERSFSLPVDVASAPELLARLRGTPARIEDLVRNASAESLVAQPEGSWSAQENVGHLLDLEPLWLGRLEDFLNGAGELRPADLQNRRTHEANHNATELKVLLKGLRAARQEFVTRLGALAVDEWRRTSKHPRLQQPMTVADHAFFVAEHDDHHLVRVATLLE